MVATNTTNKSLSEPASGDLNWDVNLNANFTAIDKAFGSFVSIATITGNYNLVTADLQNMCLKSNTSAFTGNVTYTIPNGIAGQWVVINQSASSAFTLSVVCGASSVAVDRTTVRSIYCDGTTVSYADTPFAAAGSNTQIIYNSAGSLTGSANLKFNGTTLLTNAILDASGGNTATINGIIPTGAVNVQPFTSSGTWTKPSGATVVLIRLVNGGAAGSSGTAGSFGAGGGGGQGGLLVEKYYTASLLPSTVFVTVGGSSGTTFFSSYARGVYGNQGASADYWGGGGGGDGGRGSQAGSSGSGNTPRGTTGGAGGAGTTGGAGISATGAGAGGGGGGGGSSPTNGGNGGAGSFPGGGGGGGGGSLGSSGGSGGTGGAGGAG